MNRIYHVVVLGKNIKKAREMQRLSQLELAEKAQISQSTLVYIEKGLKAPNVDTVFRLCEGLSISMLELATMIDASLSDKQN